MSTVTVVLAKDEFYAGETVEGQVVCNFKNEKYIDSISVTFRGESFVRFSEPAWQNRSLKSKWFMETIYFSSEEIFLEKTFSVFDKGDSKEAIRIPPGLHNFPFTYTLPETLPSSFGAIDFRIFYTAKASIIRPSHEPYDSEYPFDVFHPVDLNSFEEGLCKEVSKIDEVSVTKCCSEFGNISLTVTIPKIGYAVKEIIPVDCKLTNSTEKNVKKLTASLKQIIEYFAQRPVKKTRIVERTLCESIVKDVGNSKEYSTQLKLKIDTPFSVPELSASSIIKVEYKIYVFAETPLGCKNILVYIPVSCGHIPLRNCGDVEVPVFELGQTEEDNSQVEKLKNDNPPSYHEVVNAS